MTTPFPERNKAKISQVTEETVPDRSVSYAQGVHIGKGTG